MLKYRADIDGLRAVAVLAVLINHMNRQWLPGGFVGVDLFFVISGFLITAIIYHEMKLGEFSFQGFYIRRIRRILPAFFAMTVGVFVIGWLAFDPGKLISLSKSVLSTLFFASNLRFARLEGGYFDGLDSAPLLHTWSLAVEEQYYFIWPITLLLMLRQGLSAKRLMLSLLFASVLSFLVATWMAIRPEWSDWSYFSLPTRAGELLVGSILAIYMYHSESVETSSTRRFSQSAGSMAAFLLVVSLWGISEYSLFPGVTAVLPCAAAALVIYARDSWFNRLLALRPMVFIGLLSYSLYLWHWPVLAFMRYLTPYQQSQPELVFYTIALVCSFSLAYISWRWVEQPFRKSNLTFWPMARRLWLIPSATLAAAFVLVLITHGAPWRFSETQQYLTSITLPHAPSRSNQFGEYLYHSPNSHEIALVGDSHGQVMETLFTDLGKERGVTVRSFAASSCAPGLTDEDLALRASWTEKACHEREQRLAESLDKVKSVVLVGRWDTLMFTTYDNSELAHYGKNTNYGDKLSHYINALQAHGKRVVVLAQMPKYNLDFGKAYVLGLELPYRRDQLSDAANQYLRGVVEQTGATWLDLSGHFCQSGECSPYAQTGLLLYKDDDHLNVVGARWLAKALSETERNILLM